MSNGLEALASMEYPGRFIIIGRAPDGEHNVVVYGITGRSPSSQARRLEIDEHNMQVFVRPTNEEILKGGNPDLLIYPAMHFYSNGIVVSNGRQTSDIAAHMFIPESSERVLMTALFQWDYEPDEPNFTPRISGCLRKNASLSIIKRAEDGSSVRHYFGVPLIAGKGKLISTYTGLNQNPLPSFQGEPLDVVLSSNTAQDTAREAYNALLPANPEKDFRVAVVAVHASVKGLERQIEIVNRHDLRRE